MNISTTSFFASVASEEKSMTLPGKGKPEHFKVNYQRMLTFAHLVFTICSSTADAVVASRYRNFDAIIKNFGCQMTALDVQQKVKMKSVHEEARRVQALCTEKLLQTEAMFAKPPVGACGMSVVEYTKHVGLDFEATSDFIDLVIFRILHIVHDTKVERGEEVPYTNTDPLELMKNSSKCCVSGKFMSINTWVHSLQVQESHKAARFVQRLLPECEIRTASSGIVAAAQSESVQAVMRAVKGILVVRNKLSLNKVAITGAVKDVVFMRMPEERILNDEEVAALRPNKAVVVLEGYRKSTSLEKTISEVGLFTLLEVTLAKMEEFTSSFPQEPLIVRHVPDIVVDFRPDHIYCASVQEERDEAT